MKGCHFYLFICIFEIIFHYVKNQNISISLGTDQILEPDCNTNTCPESYGECINNICLCGAGYTTVESSVNNRTYSYDQLLNNKQSNNLNQKFFFCNYAFKYKDYAANFEAILPFGVGHFYTHRYLHALFKCILFWFLSFNKIVFKKTLKLYPLVERLYRICLWVFALTYVVDYICFYFSYYTDGNGMMLL